MWKSKIVMVDAGDDADVSVNENQKKIDECFAWNFKKLETKPKVEDEARRLI